MDILKSRSFWTGVFSTIVIVLVNLFPELNDSAQMITEALVVITLAIVARFAVVDAIDAQKSKPTKYDL